MRSGEKAGVVNFARSGRRDIATFVVGSWPVSAVRLVSGSLDSEKGEQRGESRAKRDEEGVSGNVHRRLERSGNRENPVTGYRWLIFVKFSIKTR